MRTVAEFHVHSRSLASPQSLSATECPAATIEPLLATCAAVLQEPD
jgi:hypothetical protein